MKCFVYPCLEKRSQNSDLAVTWRSIFIHRYFERKRDRSMADNDWWEIGRHGGIRWWHDPLWHSSPTIPERLQSVSTSPIYTLKIIISVMFMASRERKKKVTDFCCFYSVKMCEIWINTINSFKNYIRLIASALFKRICQFHFLWSKCIIWNPFGKQNIF
jgi:hypothetical protein